MKIELKLLATLTDKKIATQNFEILGYKAINIGRHTVLSLKAACDNAQCLFLEA